MGVTVEDRLLATHFRGPGFDHIRLFAATVVLLHHSRGLQYPDIRDDALLHYSLGFMDFGRFAVVIFFAISGFLVTPGLLHKASVVDYAVHRGVRIFPGLVVNVLLTILVLGPILTTHSLMSYYTDPHTYLYAKNISTLMVRYLPGVVASDGDPVIVNGALWTLHFEVLCYITLGLFGAFGLLSRRNFFLALWCMAYATYVAASMSPAFGGLLPDRLLTFVSLFVYFGAGALLYLFRAHLPFSVLAACAALMLALVALPMGLGAIIMPLGLPYLMMFFGLSALPGKMPLRYDLSYGVYLIHAPILTLIIIMFPSMHTWWIGAAIIFSVTLVLAFASWTFIEGPVLKRKKVASNWVHRRIDLVMPPVRVGDAARTPAAE